MEGAQVRDILFHEWGRGGSFSHEPLKEFCYHL